MWHKTIDLKSKVVASRSGGANIVERMQKEDEDDPAKPKRLMELRRVLLAAQDTWTAVECAESAALHDVYTLCLCKAQELVDEAVEHVKSLSLKELEVAVATAESLKKRWQGWQAVGRERQLQNDNGGVALAQVVDESSFGNLERATRALDTFSWRDHRQHCQEGVWNKYKRVGGESNKL